MSTPGPAQAPVEKRQLLPESTPVLRLLNTSDMHQRCAGSGVLESIPEGVSIFQQKPEQDQEWIFLIGPGAGAVVISSRVFLTFSCIFALYINCFTGVKQDQELIKFVLFEVKAGQESIFEAQ